jgi:hypothetical protein
MVEIYIGSNSNLAWANAAVRFQKTQMLYLFYFASPDRTVTLLLDGCIFVGVQERLQEALEGIKKKSRTQQSGGRNSSLPIEI